MRPNHGNHGDSVNEAVLQFMSQASVLDYTEVNLLWEQQKKRELPKLHTSTHPELMGNLL